MSLVKVLFDFEGQEAGELSIDAGNIVRLSKMNQMPTSSGWVLVETTRAPLTKGYVPAGYLSEPLSEEERIPVEPKVSTVRESTSPQPRIRRLSDPRLSNYLEETQEFLKSHKSRAESSFLSGRNDVSLPLPLQSTRSPEKFGSSTLVEFRRNQVQFGQQKVTEEELQRMLQRNDQWLSQVQDARNRKNIQTESALLALKKSLALAREKSQDLATQLNRLGTDIEHKRNKWSKKLEEAEKQAIAAQFAH